MSLPVLLQPFNIKGIVIAGVGELKHRLIARLPSCISVASVMDLAYGGMDGFMLACKESESRMGSAILTREREAVVALEEAISKDNGYTLGAKQVANALDAGAVSVLILSDEFDESEMLKWMELARLSGVNTVQTVSRTIPEGTRLIDGLTGIGGILRWVLVNVEEDSVYTTDLGTEKRIIDEEIDFM